GAGITFAVCKGTEGLNYVDPTFVSNVLHAKAVNIPIGLYHFARPDVNKGLTGADAEAAYFWNTISNYVIADGVSLMPMLDFEQDVSGANPAYTKATLSAWVNEWCNDIVNYGVSNGVTVTPIVYTYTSYSTGTSGNGPGMDNTVTIWPLWMASYNGRN